jgi:hypothetical protein
MAQFPTLKTGAVAQYPAQRTVKYQADVVWFLDGSEQRFRNAPSALHEWTIALEGLDEQEMAALERFFLASQGQADTFSFTDPWSGVVYPTCSLTADNMSSAFSGPLKSSAQITVRENRT